MIECTYCGQPCRDQDHLSTHELMRHESELRVGTKRLIEVTEHGRRIFEILCKHREWVPLYDFTNTCEEGCDYNSSGQHLAPRSQWGEETGETAEDILSAQANGFPGFGTFEYER